MDFITKALNKFLWGQKEENRNLLIRRYFYADSINNLAEQFAEYFGRDYYFVLSMALTLGFFVEYSVSHDENQTVEEAGFDSNKTEEGMKHI